MAISCSRRVASASSRQATLPQAARRTSATAPKSSHSERRTPPTCCSFKRRDPRAPAGVGPRVLLPEARLNRVSSALRIFRATRPASAGRMSSGFALRATASAAASAPRPRSWRPAPERRRHDADNRVAGPPSCEPAADRRPDRARTAAPRTPSLITVTGATSRSSSAGTPGRAPAACRTGRRNLARRASPRPARAAGALVSVMFSK